MLSDKQLIEKAKRKFGDEDIVKDAFVTESSGHIPIIILRNDKGVIANYQVLDNGELFRLGDLPPNIKNR